MLHRLLFVLLFLFSTGLYRQLHESTERKVLVPVYEKPSTLQVFSASSWADSILNTLTDEQKIGQLFMVSAYSSGVEMNASRIEKLINEYNIGGVIYFKGDPVAQANLTNRYQSISKVPLLIGADAEWGLGMRLGSVMDLPRHMTTGAITDLRLSYELGVEIAKQLKRVGVHVNFGPVADVNSNPNNPIIGQRSFGESPENVARKGIAFIKGMQHNGIIACAKHFPGHGDTHDDSHYSLPVIAHNQERLENVELYPFRQMIADSVMGILVGHLQVPYYDSKPASVSEKIVKGLLRENMGFQGLVFTDALNMRGITRSTRVGDLELQALQAGNDVLLCPENVPEAIRRIKEAVVAGQLPIEEINTKVRKILLAKAHVGLHQWKPIDLNGVYQDLHQFEAKSLKRRLYENAVTVARNEESLLPFKHLDTTKFISVAIGEQTGNPFQKTLSEYASFKHFAVNKSVEADLTSILSQVEPSQVVIVSLHQMSYSPRRNFGVARYVQDFIARLQEKAHVVLCVFGSPYALRSFPEVPTLVCGYEDDDAMQTAVAQVVFGAIAAKGQLPVSAGMITAGTGIKYEALGRLVSALPEDVGMKSEKLKAIDEIVNQAITERAFPGCQVLVARKGKVIFKRNYGKLTYTAGEPVWDYNIYDLASVTKVAATLQAIMLLHERKALDINEKAITYLPELKGTNKEQMVIRDLLMHQAGLVAYIPFWERTVTRSEFKPEFYASTKHDQYSLLVADSLYAAPVVRDSVWKWLIKSPLTNKREKDGKFGYIYSDLGLIMLQQIVERITSQPLDMFVHQNFYEPLGMSRTSFNPLTHGFFKNEVAPTENDKAFRQVELRGTVQDQQAAMLGGVSGHAGLFSTASDLAILMQMNLQLGYYGGHRYFLPSTVPFFSKEQTNSNHRGLGWDRKPENEDGNSYISPKTSSSAFGHSGYTGTLVWADPEKELVLIFLSNRVHPSASNTKINSLKVRRRVMDAVYEAME
ncbi:MAG: glycoside hydrolase family 3 N-terminal domain-containing protein [Spirosomataceae bacterium]